MPKVTYRFEGRELTTEVKPGTNLLDAAQQCGAREGHACGGVCACSTCHVYVTKGFDSLIEAEDAEQDILGEDLRVFQPATLLVEPVVRRFVDVIQPVGNPGEILQEVLCRVDQYALPLGVGCRLDLCRTKASYVYTKKRPGLAPNPNATASPHAKPETHSEANRYWY